MGNRQVNPQSFVECDAMEDINFSYSVETDVSDLGEIMHKIDSLQSDALNSYKTHIHAALSYLLNIDASLPENRIRVYLFEHNRTRILRVVIGKQNAASPLQCIYRKSYLHLLFGVVVGAGAGSGVVAGRGIGR